MARFAGKIAAITGAASGLGREVALRMASEGAAGLLLIDRDTESLENVATAARARGAKVVVRALDVTDTRAMAAAAQAADGDFGGIDILVSAAGILGAAVPVVDCPRGGVGARLRCQCARYLSRRTPFRSTHPQARQGCRRQLRLYRGHSRIVDSGRL